MRRILNLIYDISGVLAALFLLAIFVIVIIQVFFNMIDKGFLIMTGSPVGLIVPSYADFSGYFLAATTSFALAYTFRGGAHIRVSLFLTALRTPTRRMLELITTFFASLLMIYITYCMLDLVLESYRYGDVSSGTVPVKIWMVQAPLFIGFLTFSISITDAFVTLALGGFPSHLMNANDYRRSE